MSDLEEPCSVTTILQKVLELLGYVAHALILILISDQLVKGKVWRKTSTLLLGVIDFFFLLACRRCIWPSFDFTFWGSGLHNLMPANSPYDLGFALLIYFSRLWHGEFQRIKTITRLIHVLGHESLFTFERLLEIIFTQCHVRQNGKLWISQTPQVLPNQLQKEESRSIIMKRKPKYVF